MRTLIVRPGAIGDALLTFPILNILREQDLDPHITLVSNAAILPLARAFGLAEEVSSYDHPQWSELFSFTGIASPMLREFLQHTDRVICWLKDPDGIVERNLLAADIASVMVTPGRPPRERQGLHEVVYLAQTLGLPPVDVTAPFVPPTRLTSSYPLDSRTVAIHPGSGGANKCWPVSHFRALIDRLCSRGLPVLLFGGPADHERITALLEARAPRYGNGHSRGTLVQTLVDAPLLDVAQRLQQCGCYVGNDAGITHLSALLGVPTVAIFGPSDPATWRPLGPTVKVIRAQPMEQLTVDTVIGIIETLASFSLERDTPI